MSGQIAQPLVKDTLGLYLHCCGRGEQESVVQFPRIESLDDVVPHISYERGFAVSRRGDHTVVDYVFAPENTFSNAVSLECRGLKFGRDGRIVARPFHKFFNLGERQRLEDIDWSAPHRVQAKLDGSMIHPAMINSDMVFMTRMGTTDQSVQARGHARAADIDLCLHLIAGGVTPIFEFTSPDNRIVVTYDRPQLTFLAARDMVTGDYLPHAEIDALAKRFDVAVPTDHGPVGDAHAFVDRARVQTGIEGHVLAFDDGHRLKLKADAYVLRHKALAKVHLEKNVLGWICNGTVDDVLPLLPDDIANQVLTYRDRVGKGIATVAEDIVRFAELHRELSRKEFAAKAFAGLDRRLTHTAFAALDGKDVRTELMAILAAASQSESKIDTVRDLFGLHWSIKALLPPALEP